MAHNGPNEPTAPTKVPNAETRAAMAEADAIVAARRKTTKVEASSFAFLRNNAEMLDAAEHCLSAQRFMPALVLMYSHIDTLAWAAAGASQTLVRVRFEQWVDRWLLPRLPSYASEITATDLYAARCAVLHTLTGKSDLSKAGKAREFSYAWGTGQANVLQHGLAKSGLGHLALHYDDLLAGLRSAVADFFKEAEADSDISKALELAASQHYTSIALS